MDTFGVFLMYLYPGAFVDIGDSVHKLPPLAQLRVFCGGVWHELPQSRVQGAGIQSAWPSRGAGCHRDRSPVAVWPEDCE